MTSIDLEKVIAQTGHERYRWLTSDANPDAESREAYRRLVARLAAAGLSAPPEPPPYPPLAEQLGNAAKAAVRFVASGLATAGRTEYARRRAVCRACPSGLYDAAADRCRACGCLAAVKPWSAAESCPKGHW